ncbi:MAG: cytochrome c [Burkholderiaceae bacterium]
MDVQRGREHADPDEGVRPLPWFLVMLLGAMAMWGAFYIYISPSGSESAYGDQRTLATLRPPEATSGATAAVDGKQLFGSKCAACHQATGQGVPGVFPPLAGSEWVAGDEKILINILLHGVMGELQVKGGTYKGAMPAWKAMSDNELAAVMTYIRSEWGNQAAAIKPDSVKAQREATKTRTESFKGEEELKSAS